MRKYRITNMRGEVAEWEDEVVVLEDVENAVGDLIVDGKEGSKVVIEVIEGGEHGD
jgi:hypothetical protein